MKDLIAQSFIQTFSYEILHCVQDDRRSNITLFLLSYTPSQDDILFVSIVWQRLSFHAQWHRQLLRYLADTAQGLLIANRVLEAD